MKMLKNKYIQWLLVACFIAPAILLLSCRGNANKSESEHRKKSFVLDDTQYELPYEIPTEEGIIKVVEKLYQRIDQSTAYKVINKNTGKAITDLSIADSNAIVDIRKGDYNLWDYTVGVIHTGMFAVGEVLNDKKYIAYPINNFDFIFDNLPYFREHARHFGSQKGTYHRIINMHALDHCGSIGASLIQAYGYKKRPEFKEMIDTVEQFILHKQFRLADGTLARQRPQEVSVWADDFYMSIPFLARMGTLSGDTLYYNDAIRQVLQMSSYLFNWNKQIYDHGWNQCAGKYDPRYYWGRANGWAMMATVTLLNELPQDYPLRDSVLTIYQTHAQGIAELQGGNGLWHNVLDRNDTYSETSASAMFVYSLAKGVNNGWIDHSYGAVAQAGWNGLIMYITDDGLIENMCTGTTFSPDLVYYYHRPPSFEALHGYGPMLLAGAEMINLLRNPKLEIIKQWRTYHYKTK